MKSYTKYIILLSVLIVLFVWVEYNRPKPIDWATTYSNQDMNPFGSKALYELLANVFKGQEIKSLRVPIYNQLAENKLPKKSNYIFVCDKFEPSKIDREKLLDYVEKGNNVFIAAYYFSDSLGKALNFQDSVRSYLEADTTLKINFTNSVFKAKQDYVFMKDDGRNFLVLKNPCDAEVLGKNARGESNFIKIARGKGNFYLSSLPLAFTNFYALDKHTSDYAFKAMSYMPLLPTYWDEYLKQGRFDEDNQSIFRYIKSQRALNVAYWLILVALGLYMIFGGKRTQRVIPVIEAPRNTTLEFVDTVGQMYYHQADHLNIAQKKVNHFLAFVREKFGLKTNILDDNFIKNLTAKSGISIDEIRNLVAELNELETRGAIIESTLWRINEKIENFYAKI